ncbi:MAG: DUF3471 domain-containing protein [Caulobacteraceae bacterium]|nr:DUF3471 domain-containing protein [Caulobacteraceae bacterium]
MTSRTPGHGRLAAALLGAAFASLPLGASMSGQAAAQPSGEAGADAAQAERSRLLADQVRPRAAIPFDPSLFDKYVGYYRLDAGPASIFTITRSGEHFLTRLSGQVNVEIYPESGTKFFAKVVAAQISFETDPQGKVTGLVLHQGGFEQHATRIDEAQAKAVEAALEARIKANTPSPGTEAALRKDIESLEKGAPDYDDMSPDLASLARQQWPTVEQLVAQWGALQSIRFKAVSPQGLDIYDVTFEHRLVEANVAPLTPNGKIAGLSLRPLP